MALRHQWAQNWAPVYFSHRAAVYLGLLLLPPDLPLAPISQHPPAPPYPPSAPVSPTLTALPLTHPTHSLACPPFPPGEDREALSKVDRKLTEEEEKKMKQVLVIDGIKRVVEKILGRRKLKSSYEYEVQWVGCHPDQNAYLPRDDLVTMGFEKLVNECDAKEAAAQGLYAKPLTAVNISKHLEEFGLDTEFSTHSLMRGLSGGQKVCAWACLQGQGGSTVPLIHLP